jgi:hypothetical protein
MIVSLSIFTEANTSRSSGCERQRSVLRLLPTAINTALSGFAEGFLRAAIRSRSGSIIEHGRLRVARHKTARYAKAEKTLRDAGTCDGAPGTPALMGLRIGTATSYDTGSFASA